MGQAAWYVTARKCAVVLIVDLFLDIHTIAETVTMIAVLFCWAALLRCP